MHGYHMLCIQYVVLYCFNKTYAKLNRFTRIYKRVQPAAHSWGLLSPVTVNVRHTCCTITHLESPLQLLLV